MIPISDSDFLDMVEGTLFNIPSFYMSYYDYFELLYKTGMRPDEPLFINLFTVSGPNEIQQKPFKGNNNRTYSLDDLTNRFTGAVISQHNYYRVEQSRQLNRVFSHIMGVNSFFVGDKSIGPVSYRYAKVKSLHYNGYSAQEIKNIFGWTNPSMVSVYLGAQIFLGTK